MVVVVVVVAAAVLVVLVAPLFIFFVLASRYVLCLQYMYAHVGQLYSR